MNILPNEKRGCAFSLALEQQGDELAAANADLQTLAEQLSGMRRVAPAAFEMLGERGRRIEAHDRDVVRLKDEIKAIRADHARVLDKARDEYRKLAQENRRLRAPLPRTYTPTHGT